MEIEVKNILSLYLKLNNKDKKEFDKILSDLRKAEIHYKTFINKRY